MKVYRTGPETERLRLRSLTAEDAEAFYQINSHPDVMRLTGEPPLESPESARTAIERYPDFDTYGYGRWGCVLKESGALIGFCGLKYLPQLDAVDVGYRFLPEYWGRGLATEACRACVTFGFEVLDLKRIIGLALPANAASIRVLEKSGLSRVDTIEFEGETAIRYEITRP